MNHCLKKTHLDSHVDAMMERLSDRQRKRGRPLSDRSLEGRVRSTVRDYVACEVLMPDSDLICELIHTTDFGRVGFDFPELDYFRKFAAHPDFHHCTVEFDVPRLLAGYCAAAAGSILADLRGRG